MKKEWKRTRIDAAAGNPLRPQSGLEGHDGPGTRKQVVGPGGLPEEGLIMDFHCGVCGGARQPSLQRAAAHAANRCVRACRCQEMRPARMSSRTASCGCGHLPFGLKASRALWECATASLASNAQAVSSRRLPASPLFSKSSVLPPRREVRFQVLSGLRHYRLPHRKKATRSPLESRWARLQTRAFRLRKYPSTIVAGTRGCSCRRVSRRTKGIPT